MRCMRWIHKEWTLACTAETSFVQFFPQPASCFIQLESSSVLWLKGKRKACTLNWESALDVESDTQLRCYSIRKHSFASVWCQEPSSVMARSKSQAKCWKQQRKALSPFLSQRDLIARLPSSNAGVEIHRRSFDIWRASHRRALTHNSEELVSTMVWH